MIPYFVFLTCLTTASEESWPSFLGQGHTPLSVETLPLEWSLNKNFAWATELSGKGQSSPVIWNRSVYVTAIDGTMKDHCYIVALNLEDGSTLWEKKIDASQMVRSNYFQSRSAPTPCVDANGIYAFFETGNFLALSHSGEVL